MTRGNGPLCSFCTVAAAFLVTRGLPGDTGAVSCKSHLSIAVSKVCESLGVFSVTIGPLVGKTGIPAGASPGTAEVAEQARRVGAYSANHPLAAHTMEDALYLAVLGMIAQGAPEPAALAATALLTQRYDFERNPG
jgi:hypothetical protein